MEREGASIVLQRELWQAARVEQEARQEYDPWDDDLVEVAGTIERGKEQVESREVLKTWSEFMSANNGRLTRTASRIACAG
jgi:hypothetical protein